MREIERRLIDLGEHRHDGSARAAVLDRLDGLLPTTRISTTKYAETRRKLIGPTGEAINWSRDKTPYIVGIQDACDQPGVKCVAVSGNARSTKTTAFENRILKMATFGPLQNLLWLMQSDEALDDYIDERGEWMLQNHEEVEEKINWTDRRNGRKRKRIGKALWLWRVAKLSLLVAKAAPFIVADEIDSYQAKVRKALLTLIRNRQREYGSGALAMLASHPDAGEHDGITKVVYEGTAHHWYWRCPSCGQRSSPAQKAETRMTWNVPEMLALADTMPREELLAKIEREAALVCPHADCGYHVQEDERLAMSASGIWLQPHQSFADDDMTVMGEPVVSGTMGFVIHAFMTPFIRLGEIAREWAAAKLTFDDTGDDTDLRQTTCKTMGEFYQFASEDTQIDDWRVLKARCTSTYRRGTVPLVWDDGRKIVVQGPKFLIAFVDIQASRFEVRIMGYDLAKRSWLIDAYAIKQWPGFSNINPANRIEDWDIIEQAVIRQTFALADNDARVARGGEPLFMPIAKTVIDAAGEPGVANNARRWMSNILGRPSRGESPIIQSYRVQLVQGSRYKTGPLEGKPRAIDKDDHGKLLEPKVFVRDPNVHDVKKIIARRLRIAEEGAPGRFHLPLDLPDTYVKEAVSERYINDEWVANGRNETWDGLVMGEVGRILIQPDRPGLWETTPIWAHPVPRGESIDEQGSKRVSYLERLVEYNRGI